MIITGFFPVQLVVNPSKTMTIEINGVMNPSSVKDSDFIVLETTDANGNLIDQSDKFLIGKS